MSIVFDDSDFKKKTSQFILSVINKQKKAVNDVASEIMRLSQFEVPHNVGTLQNSGHVEPQEDGVLVGYNTPYAARLHEHPEYHFQKGRKGKYLEDPIKNNIRIFKKYFDDIFNK